MSAPDPAVPASALVNGLGTEVLDVAVSLAPVAVPFVLALAAIAWVMRKFGLAERVELARLDREAAALEAKRALRRQRTAARKQAKWNAMHDEALTMNRRHDLRRRFSGSSGRASLARVGAKGYRIGANYYDRKADRIERSL
jgi:hypothetical protein